MTVSDEELTAEQRDKPKGENQFRMSDRAIEKQLADDPNGSVTVEMFEMLINGERDPFEDAQNDVRILESMIESGVGRRHPWAFDELCAEAEEKVARAQSPRLLQRLSFIRDERLRWRPAT